MLNKAKIDKVIKVFNDNYKLVPLEVFADDSYKVLISTLMSSRTRDETTLQAAERLFRKAPNVNKLEQLDEVEIKNLIYPVGFYKTKAKHIRILAQVLNKDFGGFVPHTKEELTKLPGVGGKTANLVLNRAFDIPAIAVDTHVHRITNMLGWVKTKTPEQTEKQLIKILPKKYWSDINRLFVSIGRQYYSNIKLKDFLINNGLI